MQDTTRQPRVWKILQDRQEYARYYKTTESKQDATRQTRVCKILQDRQEYARYYQTD